MTYHQTQRVIIFAFVVWGLFCAAISSDGDFMQTALLFLLSIIPVLAMSVAIAGYLYGNAANKYAGRNAKPHCTKCENAGLDYQIEVLSMVKEWWGGDPRKNDDDYKRKDGGLRSAMCSRGHRIALPI